MIVLRVGLTPTVAEVALAADVKPADVLDTVRGHGMMRNGRIMLTPETRAWLSRRLWAIRYPSVGPFYGGAE